MQTNGSSSGIPHRTLGRTGVPVSVIGLGGWHIGSVADTDDAIRMMHAAIDAGITFFDNSWDYHDGGSEELMGRALAGGHRNRVFLMSKGCDRDYDGAKRHIDDSLRRLRTDRLDLWQFHEVNCDNDPDWILEKGGLRAAVEARQAGKIRFIGFTGHKDPAIHLKMLELPIEWDTSMMPVSVCDHWYRSFEARMLPACRQRNIGAIGMKALGGGKGNIPPGTGITGPECLRYAMSQDIATLVTGIDSWDVLKQAIRVATGFVPMTAEEQADVRRRARPFAGDGRFEMFKSSKAFDGPYHRVQHGFPAKIDGCADRNAEVGMQSKESLGPCVIPHSSFRHPHSIPERPVALRAQLLQP
jgi:aryl-alcohol dehydrogenase-like predicted oxidoreductase